MISSYRFVLKSGPGAGQVFTLEKEESFIGREMSNEIVINDPEVSRRHARVYLQGANYVIEDLGSTNGTSVNGQRLMGPYMLRPGEMVTFGEHTNLLFEAVAIDPDATMVSMRQTAVPQTPVKTPAQEAAYSAPAYPPPPARMEKPVENYAGQVPQQPAAPVKKKKPLPVWAILLIIFVIILACGCIGFIVFDSLNLYCNFPGIMNMFIPGACPP